MCTSALHSHPSVSVHHIYNIISFQLKRERKAISAWQYFEKKRRNDANEVMNFTGF